MWSGATWEEKVSSWPLIDFNQWVVVWVWDKVVGKRSCMPLGFLQIKKNQTPKEVLWTFTSAFFFGITHLNYHGLLQFGYCWLCSIFLLLNGKEGIVNAKIWEELVPSYCPSPSLFPLVPRVYVNTEVPTASARGIVAVNLYKL